MSDTHADGSSTQGSGSSSQTDDVVSLFVPAPGIADGARSQSVSWANNWFSLADAFREAAELLSQAPMNARSASYAPAALLWRHHIELVLKVIYIQYRDFTDQSQEILRTHSIKALWRTVSELILRFDPCLAHVDLEVVQEVLLQLDAVDPRGEDFRYPVRAGDPTVRTLQGLSRIHMPTFNAGMVRASDWLRQRNDDLSSAVGQKWWDTEGREEYSAEPWEPPPIDHLAGFEWWLWRYGE